MFTASTEHDSKTMNTITYTCFNRISIHQYPWVLETLKNLDGLSDGTVCLQWKRRQVLAMSISKCNNWFYSGKPQCGK